MNVKGIVIAITIHYDYSEGMVCTRIEGYEALRQSRERLRNAFSDPSLWVEASPALIAAVEAGTEEVPLRTVQIEKKTTDTKASG